MSKVQNKYALISVSDKSNIEDIARSLVDLGYTILSTGGTAKYLTSMSIPNVSVSDFTEFEEILGGRVKTLHPKIHAGILAKSLTDLQDCSDVYDLIDIVIVNLYPFEKTISKSSCTYEDAIENIDIGGPAMLRAAAKNHNRVTVITDPNDYTKVIEEIRKNSKTTISLRRYLAHKVFKQTSVYDAAIRNYLYQKNEKTDMIDDFSLVFEKESNLRYGENPHQKAALYEIKSPKFAGFDYIQVSGKELSYNNIVDSESALSCVKQFKKPACVIVKHANPCGVAEGKNINDAYNSAYKTDPTSAFGGIIAFNKKLDDKLLSKILSQQYEIKTLKNKLLIQETDDKELKKSDLNIVSKQQPTSLQLEDLMFAFKVSRYVKSNSIIFVKNKKTLAIGAGQMSRIDSTNIAKTKAKNQKINLKGSVMASEAFFPFRDNVDLAKKIGVSSILQPGGSIKDQEIIDVANSHGISMVFSGIRVFKH
jgi:phosphoribosylaminoimidazolecarboxamide formyltransferase/IMP cyclohydrolase